MKKDKFTFSSDKGSTYKDRVETAKLAEEYFGTEKDPNQIPVTAENRNWIEENIPECRQVIKNNGKIIGFTFIIPCNKDIMNKFLKNKISENQLFEEVKKKVNYKNFDTIYLCSSFLKPEFRGKGYALEGISKSIKKIIGKRKIKPILFYDAWTQEGKKSANRVAKFLGFDIIKK